MITRQQADRGRPTALVRAQFADAAGIDREHAPAAFPRPLRHGIGRHRVLARIERDHQQPLSAPPRAAAAARES
jgi:hypothetical protein